MARYCVTCGDGIDLVMKLWHLQNLKADHTFKTGQLKHGFLQQEATGLHDLYAVTGGTKELRVYTIGMSAKSGLKCIEKVTTVTHHSKEIVAVALAGVYCCTVGLDRKILISEVDVKHNTNTIIAERKYENANFTNSSTVVAIWYCERTEEI